MAQIRLRGMTWDHPRAVEPLKATLPAFRAIHPGIDITWDARPLHGFEFTPIEALAQRFDLIVLDHPFCGDIARNHCLVPVDDLVGPDEDFVGPSLASYRAGGHVWAVPIDAACQVSVSRPDLMAALDAETPRRWSEVVALGRSAHARGLKLAIALKGVHSLMSFFTLCANLGRPCGADFVEAETARAGLAALRELLPLCPPECLDWNSIALHEAMARRDDLAFCPAVYCYATYAEADRPHPLAFHDLPGPQGLQGSTVGGTGLGISANCRDLDAAAAYARFAGEASTQLAFARHHGQPARIEAWRDAGIDRRFGHCFSATRATMEAAWTRPRHAGYLAFQASGGDLIERHLRGTISETDVLASLLRAYEASEPEPV